MLPIVIVGSGLAGYSLVREIRKQNNTFPITVISQDEGYAYAKPMLSIALSQHKTPANFINNTAEQMVNQYQLQLLSHTEVSSIDREHNLLHTRNGTVRYQALVLAQGADPIRLPLASDAAKQSLYINNLMDYNVFRHAIAAAKHITILGAGLLGCEFANDLCNAGYQVSIVDLAAYPLAKLLPEIAGQQLISPFEQIGVEWHFGVTVKQINQTSTGYQVTLTDNSILNTNVVLSALGLQPRINLAQQASLTVQHGIVVDKQLRTNDQQIFALGDCAEINGSWQPYVAPIMHAAHTLAKVLLGENIHVQFPIMPVIIKTPAHPVVVVPVAHHVPGEWRILAQGNGTKLGFYDPEESLRGFVLTGEFSSDRIQMLNLMSQP